MAQKQSIEKNKILNSIIILLSIVGLIVCIAILFPQTRHKMMDMAEQIVGKKSSLYQYWIRALLSYSMGGICLILFFDYCTLTKSGKLLVFKVKQEIIDCLSEINFRSFIKPVILLSVVYLLGILTIIRANFLYIDDIGRTAAGFRVWYDDSRYISEFGSIFIHADTHLTDISPLPLLLAILILSLSSVLLVYVICNRKITTVRLLASIPLGLSPYYLECLSYKFDAPYMALSILASIVPFLFINRKKAFIFCSVAFLLVMCMTYQAVAGIYMSIVVILCFKYWNSREKQNKEILSFLGTSILSFCFAMLFFKLFLMKPSDFSTLPLPQLFPGILNNIKSYVTTINSDFGVIWKTGILFVSLFFISKSLFVSEQRKIHSLLISIPVIVISFILSFGIYLLLPDLWFLPRNLIGFGVFLAIICIYAVSDYKKIATIVILALNWCFFVFAFSYGNALADQSRYADFRIKILLHDLSTLYPNAGREDLSIQILNSIDYTPLIKSISKNNPVIEKLVPKRLDQNLGWDYFYFLEYFNYIKFKMSNIPSNSLYIDFTTLNLPVVLDSYYHTIKSDGNRILVVLKH